ncbi:hypothetical protein CHGG_08975 [Chaetomium globosum CBS 148.51]|uniref:SH3 domain-containing protein n=1 Tax=Chaetomium globosum (strain ATCC 6205 / CBS 148.51 / DSM 1962 / NBRC 6347 / NRRL 1970) TaxID=306901 RepID=Q2GSS9_CHAGB|nr:uncharacterized protein CHGG_08975 [Chaetomium globosum CBS 148.51]EAQ84961.1 hypothetical protein CHGG_08975 [Chaetomium globosum CBS 148.51]
MPATISDAPAVALSFANNFWGKDDAGVPPLLERMHNAKQTCDELRNFYGVRASIEDEYARKLMSLSRKALGSQETGTLKTSLDVMRGEVELMAKQHQQVAAQMKSELEEPLAAFAGAMKERRKIVQNTVEKLLKTKVQQTQQPQTRDRYEQECLKIKGYLAQGHMVMGQEERKNKAKLEKTQISLATSNTEYEAAVKALEETTARWNREWKAAADKFQDLEEERLDFSKSSLWTFANIASTVCVSDDSSCEKIRLSLEKMEVEKDIYTFIKDKGTGQEIPDPPKYINFCRGDIDAQSEVSEDDNYSVAQFPRSINPAFRSSSPQPSMFESHHDPNSALARDLGHGDAPAQQAREVAATPQKVPTIPQQQNTQRSNAQNPKGTSHHRPAIPFRRKSTKEVAPTSRNTWNPPAAHNNRPQLAAPPKESQNQIIGPERSVSPDPIAANASLALNVGQNVFPVETPDRRKQDAGPATPEDDPIAMALAELKGVTGGKNGGSRMSADHYHGIATPAPGANPSRSMVPGNNNSVVAAGMRGTPPPSYDQQTQIQRLGVPPPAVTSRAMKESSQKFQQQTRSLFTASDRPNSGGGGGGGYGSRPGTGRNSSSDIPRAVSPAAQRSVSPRPSSRASRHYPASPSHRSVSPAPYAGSQRGSVSQLSMSANKRGSDAAYYGGSNSNNQSHNNSYNSNSYNGHRGSSSSAASPNEMARSTSPAPYSPRASAASPSPYGSTRGTAASPGPTGTYSPRGSMQDHSASGGGGRPGSSMSMGSRRGMDMAVQLAQVPSGGGGQGYGQQQQRQQQQQEQDDGYGGSMRGRHNRSNTATSMSMRGMSLYEGAGPVQPVGSSRTRSKSVAADPNRFTRDGRPILHFARALYMYQPAIPEELGFAKGDVLSILRHQDDGWWEATVQGGAGQVGLVPSNYLQPC